MNLPQTIASQLLHRRWKLAVAESCTGGLLAHLLTNQPGSSGWFEGGVIAYSNRIKTGLLGVPARDIEAWGAVSEVVASAMARGAAERFGVQLALSTTGIAGPGGATPDKPVGLVCFGLAHPGGVITDHKVWPHDREGNKEASVRHGLQMIIDLLESVPAQMDRNV